MLTGALEDLFCPSVLTPKAGGRAANLRQSPSQILGKKDCVLPIKVVACLLVSSALAGAGAVKAQDSGPVCDLRITHTTLGPAIGALAEQCKVPLLFPYDLAGTGGIHPVSGRRNITEALKIMLRVRF
jgi:hypothetical protein